MPEDVAPSFTQKPQLRQEDDGNRLLFECKVSSSPKPEIQWFRGETKLIEDTRTAIKVQPIGTNLYAVILELDDVIESDAGLYKVKAKNKFGEVAASINLNFSPVDEPRDRQIDGIAPTFSKKPTIRQEEDGKRLLFECRIQADPRPTVIWSHGGVEVTNDARHKLRVENDGHSYFATLEIENVTVEDAGKYKVMAKNELGESNATISLNFDSDEALVPETGLKPTFSEKPVIRQTEEGGDIVIECRLLADPKPNISWYHGTKVIKESLHTQMYIELDQKLYYLAKLNVRSPDIEDAGLYKIVASNKRGEATASVNLNFESAEKLKVVDGKAPRFPKKPTIHQEGDTLVMECLLEANPVPEIIWYQGDKVILDSNRIRMSKKATGKDQYLLKLEISNPTPQDGGNYRCNACNTYGESNANIALNFQGADDDAGFAPSFIEKPRIIPNETGTLISMKCTCTAKPKPSVSWIKGTKTVQDGGRFRSKVEEIKADTYVITLEIQDPVGPDSGTYRCQVKNEYGESNANLNLNIEAEAEGENGLAPTFIEKPKIRSEKGGKLVVMDFKVKADPKPDIVWYHEGTLLKESSRLKSSIEQKDNSYYIRLELKEPGIQDSGIYKCNLKNACGELNANLTLNIEIIPVIKEVPKTVTITKTNTVVIEAKVQSVFEPQCTWLKGSTILKDDGRHKVEVHRVKEGEFSVKLEINPANANDKGSYKLVAKNEKGETTSSIIDVILPPTVEAPVISQALSDSSAVEGEALKFVCKFAQIDKTMKISWTKNNKVVTSNESIEIKFDGQTATLVIKECKKEHEGVYKISASNTGGTTESKASLTVQEKIKQVKPVFIRSISRLPYVQPVDISKLGAIMDIIGQLPVELALEVFRYLSPQDLGACCLVSKTWRSYANADFLWRRICLKEGISLSIPFSAPLILEDYNGNNDYESMDCLPDECYPESLYYSSDNEDTSSCSSDYMENISPWAYAFACYSLRNIHNWKDNRKSVHVIATLDNTMVAVRDTTLVYSDELGVLFVYQLSDRTRFVQTIDLVLEKPLIGLDMTNQHIVVKQGDIITLYHKQLKNFVLKGFLVPVEGSYVFTRHYYPSEVSFVRHAVIHDAICILSDNCVYIYSLRNSSMRSYKVDTMSFMLSDKHRVYVGTGKNEVTGIDSNGSYIDLPLKPSSVVCIKSNQNIIVSLVSEEYHSGRYYMFKVWSKKYAYREFNTSRPFGLKVAQRGSRFAAVANDKFGQKVFVSIYDLDNDTKNDVDLNASEPIAQAKIQFIGRDLLYIVTRKDWGPYDMGYLVDLGTMTTLYDVELDHTGVVSIDSKLAVYLNTETIEIHYYNR